MKAQGIYLPDAKGAFTAPLLVCKRLLGCFCPSVLGCAGFLGELGRGQLRIWWPSAAGSAWL